jgi:hypothetical protein
MTDHKEDQQSDSGRSRGGQLLKLAENNVEQEGFYTEGNETRARPIWELSGDANSAEGDAYSSSIENEIIFLRSLSFTKTTMSLWASAS